MQLIAPTEHGDAAGVHATPGVQPELHIPVPVHEPPAHAVPIGVNASAGQEALPLQVSATSQPPATAERHVVVLPAKASAGQLTLTPLQASGRSHAPALARHVVAPDA